MRTLEERESVSGGLPRERLCRHPPLTRTLVSRALELRPPKELQGRVIKIVFRGDEPVLSEASLQFGVRIRLLSGRVENIGRLALDRAALRALSLRH